MLDYCPEENRMVCIAVKVFRKTTDVERDRGRGYKIGNTEQIFS